MPGVGGGDRRKADTRQKAGSGGAVSAAADPGKASLAPLQPFEEEEGRPSTTDLQ